VLRALHYIDDDNMVELKGKVACEIHHQELLITELMLDNRFESLEPAEVAAMLSATTCQYKMSRSGDQTQSESRPLKANLVKVCKLLIG
jgi:antiviral helicase SKI2